MFFRNLGRSLRPLVSWRMCEFAPQSLGFQNLIQSPPTVCSLLASRQIQKRLDLQIQPVAAISRLRISLPNAKKKCIAYQAKCPDCELNRIRIPKFEEQEMFHFEAIVRRSLDSRHQTSRSANGTAIYFNEQIIDLIKLSN